MSEQALLVLGVGSLVALVIVLAALLMVERARATRATSSGPQMSDEVAARIVASLPSFGVGFDKIEWGLATDEPEAGDLFLTVSGKVRWREEDGGRQQERECVVGRKVSRETFLEELLTMYLMLVMREAVVKLNEHLFVGGLSLQYSPVVVVINGKRVQFQGDGAWQVEE